MKKPHSPDEKKSPDAVDIKEKVSALKKVDFLSIMHESTLERLANESKEIRLEENEVLFSEGDPGNTMYIVLRGEILITRGQEKLTVLSSGGYFGEIALIDTGFRSTCAKASELCLLLEINETQFKNYFAAQPQALLAILKTLSTRLRRVPRRPQMVQTAGEDTDSPTQLSQSLESASTEIYICNEKTFQITESNSIACDNTGYSMKEITGLALFDLGVKFTMDSVTQLVDPLLSGTKPLVVFEASFIRKDGSVYPVEIKLQLSSFQGKPQGIVALVLDLSERKQLEGTIRAMAYYDALTGLPNRNLFNDRLALAVTHAARENQQVGILFLDLDRFKIVNDTMGHDTGDKLLQEVSVRLKDAIREGDTVARMGGDEFIIIIPGIRNPDNLGVLAQKIIDSLSSPYSINDNDVFIGASIGIAIYPNDGKEVKSLLKNADMAMYRAKENGRNNYQLYTPALNAKAMERMTMEKNLRKALKHDEFTLVYQPKINLATGQISGVEALLHWENAELGVIEPDRFIPVAEETGIIVELGEWVLFKACRQIKKWMDAGLPSMRVSINLSIIQSSQGRLASLLQKVLRDTAINPDLLELEITEGFYMKNAETALKDLKGLKDMEIQLSIDDFGSGYSSFTYLRNLPINSLKIDKAFIKEFSSGSNSAITKAIIDFGRSLGLRTIADGVEKEEQRKLLQELKCDEAQGPLFSEPLCEEKAEALFVEKKAFF